MHQSPPRHVNSRMSSNPWTARYAGVGMSAGGRISLDDRIASSLSNQSRKLRVWTGVSFGVRYVPSAVRVKLTARWRSRISLPTRATEGFDAWHPSGGTNPTGRALNEGIISLADFK